MSAGSAHRLIAPGRDRAVSSSARTSGTKRSASHSETTLSFSSGEGGRRPIQRESKPENPVGKPVIYKVQPTP